MDKIDRLLDAIEHPERYSSEEITAMLQDPEVKETFDLLDKTKSSLQTISVPNIDGEWQRFKSAHHRPATSLGFKFKNLLSRKIAASVAIAIVSLTAVAAIVGMSVHYLNRPQPALVSAAEDSTVEVTSTSPENLPGVDEEQVATPETIVFDNESLGVIIAKIADFYGYTVEFNSEKAKDLRLFFRWNQALPLDEVVESLNNFEQIHISLEDKKIKID